MATSQAVISAPASPAPNPAALRAALFPTDGKGLVGDPFQRSSSEPIYYEGAIHYMWFKEYYPEAWTTLQKYVAAGRWRLSGSWVNAADVNVSSPESLMRQALYGKRFFRREFQRTSQDVYLPDCFGFGFALPSIAANSGLAAFSTQKLTWGSSVPIPFPIGLWKGADGNSVVM
jgi:alpha-mannosidase